MIRAAASLNLDAERARSRTLRLALPQGIAVADLARLVVDARREGMHIEVVTADPPDRLEQVRLSDVNVAVVPVPPAEAAWSVSLGVAGSDRSRHGAFFFDTIRPGRMDREDAVRIWLQAEDDVPGIRDRLTRLRDSSGLAPAQLVTTQSTTVATAEVYATRDLLLCPQEQADQLGLNWQPLGDLHLVRGYDLAATDLADADHIQRSLSAAVGRCLHSIQQGTE
ncbi:LysR family transcriptional regulator [Leifsonia sp. NPDC058230]|uniref:LysR family transcriptional regulator n=1 Tax=Leifsonia sp. NPDC058230 TaxID=3346391 RepID=UPI0036DA7BDC